MQETDKQIGQRIRTARQMKRLSVSSLAASVKVHSRTIERWEAGQQSPPASSLLMIAQALNLSAAYLLTGETPGTNKARQIPILNSKPRKGT